MNIDEWEILTIAQPYSKDEKVPHGWYRYYRTVNEAEFRFFMSLIAAHPGSKDYAILIEWARRVKEIRGQVSEFI